MKGIVFRFSDSFHPHYLKFLKTGIKLNVPRYNTLWCNNAWMCAIHRLESYSEHGVKFFSTKYIFFTGFWGKERNEHVIYFIHYDMLQNLYSDLEALYRKRYFSKSHWASK